MAHSSIPSRIKRALHAPEPEDCLLALAKELKIEGVSQSTMYELFEAELVRVRSNSDERSYNALADVMDRIVGWCAPEQRLFDSQLSK
jgi:hypothetical protein